MNASLRECRRKQRGIAEDGFKGCCATHGITRYIHAGSIKGWIGFQHIFHQFGQYLCKDGIAISIRSVEIALVGRDNGQTFCAGKFKITLTFHVLTCVIAAAMECEDQRNATILGCAVQNFLR